MVPGVVDMAASQMETLPANGLRTGSADAKYPYITWYVPLAGTPRFLCNFHVVFAEQRTLLRLALVRGKPDCFSLGQVSTGIHTDIWFL